HKHFSVMNRKVKISTYSMLITIIGFSVLVALIILNLNNNHVISSYIIGGLLVVMCVLSLFFTPISISVDDTHLNVNMTLRVKSIPLKKIECVALCPPSMSEKRIFGSGGWFGYWGWFREPSIGKYFAYYGKASDCFLVKLKDGKQYILGCTDSLSIIEYISKEINC
ncbi:MAG: PH domain-containing protein, partial [Muribaculaceae bacterium]|nr:PH domain-containing protein [Muribaculaceae bacterium]